MARLRRLCENGLFGLIARVTPAPLYHHIKYEFDILHNIQYRYASYHGDYTTYIRALFSSHQVNSTQTHCNRNSNNYRIFERSSRHHNYLAS